MASSWPDQPSPDPGTFTHDNVLSGIACDFRHQRLGRGLLQQRKRQPEPHLALQLKSTHARRPRPVGFQETTSPRLAGQPPALIEDQRSRGRLAGR
jgi:hypothetical protein